MSWTKQLYTKLALVMLALFVALGVALVHINSRTSELYALEITQSVNRDIALHAAEDMPIWQNGQANEAALKELAHHVMFINPIVEVYLLDVTGNVLSHALPYGSVEMDRVDTAPLLKFLDRQNPLPIFGDDPRNPAAQKVFSVTPIKNGLVTEAYLYTVLNGQAYQKTKEALSYSYNLQTGRTNIAAALLMTVSAGLIVFFFLTRRLKALMDQVRRYRQGQFRGRIDSPTTRPGEPANDEISELQQVLSDMSLRIDQQFEEIESVDRTRRELIANVSHDLRTPLSSMQGYLETAVFKMDSLPKDELQRYLTIAHKHSRRLSQRIAQLFEIAKLESPGMQPNWEIFSLSELIHDQVQDQQLAAEERGIMLSVGSTSQQLMARADIALVHRVLENLVSNALKNTPSGGRVSVSAHSQGKRIRVEVTDNGMGILETAIPHVFDRFYSENRFCGENNDNQDTSSDPNKPGNGLGLAIVKRIMELHHSTVTVSSAPHRETVFSFWLPIPEHNVQSA